LESAGGAIIRKEEKLGGRKVSPPKNKFARKRFIRRDERQIE
jgi:hypothetical protein